MSRRVFDVGLDMGRIRNGLKHNKEGKESKRSKSYKSSHTQGDAFTDDNSLPDKQNGALIPHVQHKKSSPTIAAHQNGHMPNQPSDTITLPSSHHQEDMDSGFPLPPSNRVSFDGQPNGINGINGTGERSLHSSQLNGTPSRAQKPEPLRKTSSDHALNFDLKPPPPNTKVKHIDSLSERLFSGEHLRVILKDPNFFLRFTAFLNRYKPHSAPVLVRYLEAQKAIKAVEYANALAETIKPAPGEHLSPCPAASVDPRFEARLQRSFESLVNDALPAYITNSLTKVVTETMVREITGTGMPVMRELVGGLAEVFCLADPSIKDCPIVYASEEFYRTTRYSQDDVLGRNCRFLQGPKTDRTTIARLGAAIKAGQESCETVLNYRRDGSPFMNLLLTAPLYDNRGSVRYFIGAQIDVSGLVDEGRGLDSFERLLTESRPNRNRESDHSDESFSQKHLRTLNEFGQMLSLDESTLFQKSHSRTSSMHDTASIHRGTPNRPERMRQPRRVLGNEDEGEKKNEWALSSMGPSGKLPGVYQNYLLVRPYPSLRIIFVSPALRIPGLLQSPFLSRIGGPTHVREGLSDAFESGAAVTAKVTWLPNGRASEEGGEYINGDSRPGSRRGGPPNDNGQRTRYISCTPLLGSDDQVGVWMIVMVENELVTGSLASRTAALARYDGQIPPTPSEYQRESASMDEDIGGTGGPARSERKNSDYMRNQRRGNVGSEGGRLYADLMRHGGASEGSMDHRGEREDYMSGGINNGVDGVVSGEGRIHEIRSP